MVIISQTTVRGEPARMRLLGDTIFHPRRSRAPGSSGRDKRAARAELTIQFAFSSAACCSSTSAPDAQSALLAC